MRKIELPGWCPKIMEVSKWVLNNMKFNVLLSTIAAMNEMDNAFSVLMQRPDLLRHMLKRKVKTALSGAAVLKNTLMIYAGNEKLFDEFSDHIADVMENDVTIMRRLLQAHLEERGVQNAEIVGWVDTAMLLLHVATEHYNVTVEEGNTRAMTAIRSMGKEQEMKRHDYGRYFASHNPAGLLKAWQEVAGMADPGQDVAVEDDVLGQLQEISRKFGNGTYLRACLAEMKDEPFFADVKVENEEPTRARNN